MIIPSTMDISGLSAISILTLSTGLPELGLSHC